MTIRAASSVLALTLGLPVLAQAAPKKTAEPSVAQTPFGTLADGRKVTLYTLTNQSGAEARIIDYGAIVVSLKVPDRAGTPRDVVLGYDDLAGYVNDKVFWGDRRAVREPHRRRQVHAGREDLSAGAERRRQPPARRRAGVLQAASTLAEPLTPTPAGRLCQERSHA